MARVIRQYCLLQIIPEFRDLTVAVIDRDIIDLLIAPPSGLFRNQT